MPLDGGGVRAYVSVCTCIHRCMTQLHSFVGMRMPIIMLTLPCVSVVLHMCMDMYILHARQSATQA